MAYEIKDNGKPGKDRYAITGKNGQVCGKMSNKKKAQAFVRLHDQISKKRQ